MTPANLTYTGLRPNEPMSRWNWYDTSNSHDYVVPTPDDNLYLVGAQSPGDHTYLPVPMTATPGTMMYNYMVMMGMPVNEPFQPNRNFTIPIGSLPTVRGVHQVSNYTGTVSTSDNQRIGTLDLQTGSIGQLASSDGTNDLVITTYMGFLGGTLNNTSYLGTVHITGESGYTTPAPASANLADFFSTGLTIGSTLSIEGLQSANTGAALGISQGVYNMTNGANYCVAPFSSLETYLNNSYVPTYTTSPEDVVIRASDDYFPYTVIAIGQEGWFNLLANLQGDIGIAVEGKMNIHQNKSLNLNPITLDASLYTPEALILVKKYTEFNIGSTGVVKAYDGAEIIAKNDIDCAGKIHTIGVANADKRDVVIQGDLLLTTTSELDIGKGSETGLFRKLIVEGKVTAGGKMVFDLDGSINGNVELVKRDYIECTSIAFASSAHIDMSINGLAENAPRLDRRWDVVLSNDPIVGPAPNSDDGHYAVEIQSPQEKKRVQLAYSGS